MGQEIERKFLVTGDGWREGAEGTLYRQGYLAKDKERTVRVRVAGAKAYLTIKGRTSGTSRAEYEYEIPLKDAEELLNLCEGPLVEKTRHKIPYAGHTWEVDVFHGDNEGLIMAEVELQSEDAHVEMPDWAGKEVSGDVRYYNSSLSKKPYKMWTDT
ncbi:CYTH domain-containing protein [Roseimicrobium gellanilyticum]|uniref:CYTH domain-containing protein n=1 Tax=Roseimicrobium gellanilyticum TaxID=748857 RepID=A0A366HL83_9BACT|nr:CYTH domain-containing protein [Roseimicrobium gellanilyticum]RBP43698.1 CYTH domain-containing protein [Roseimicrobium gellanilyticum]